MDQLFTEPDENSVNMARSLAHICMNTFSPKIFMFAYAVIECVCGPDWYSSIFFRSSGVWGPMRLKAGIGSPVQNRYFLRERKSSGDLDTH